MTTLIKTLLSCALCILFVWPLLSQIPIPLLGDSHVAWMWSGAVTPNSVVIKARVRPHVERARLEVSFEEGGLLVSEFREPNAHGIVTYPVTELVPSTEYRYRVSPEKGPGLEGRFRTFAPGAMSFRIGFASCATTGSNHAIFDTLRQLNLQFFIHMGDFHYENISRNDPRLFHHAFDLVLTSPRQAAFFRSTPIAYMWDDHDYGPDDADGTSPARPAALRAYQECVPHYPLTQVAGRVETIQQAFTAGRIRFILTDSRARRTPVYEPDGPAKSILGERQLAWLEQEFRQASERYPLVVWVNGVPWITRQPPRTADGWEPYSYERTLIADLIKETGLTDRLIMLSGDAHMAAIDDGSNSNYASDQEAGSPAFPVVHAAPLDRYPRVKGGPYSHGVSAPNRWLGVYKAKQYGMMEVEDEGERIRVTLSCHDSSGQVLEGLMLSLECSSSGCEIDE